MVVPLRTIGTFGRVDRLSRDRDFTEHSLLKDKELVKLKVHRAKNTTKKEVFLTSVR